MIDRSVILTLLGMSFQDWNQRDQFIELSQVLTQYCWNEEPNTLIFSGGIAKSGADPEIDLTMDDLVFVLAFKNTASLKKHQDDLTRN